MLAVCARVSLIKWEMVSKIDQSLLACFPGRFFDRWEIF